MISRRALPRNRTEPFCVEIHTEMHIKCFFISASWNIKLATKMMNDALFLAPTASAWRDRIRPKRVNILFKTTKEVFLPAGVVLSLSVFVGQRGP
jgi:hypothetical protein